MSAINEMNLDRFTRIVEAYGAESRAWPDAERDAALAFCASSADARAMRDEARALDALLAKAELPTPDRALEDRIMAQFRKPETAIRRHWLGAGAIAASLVIGVTAAWVVLRPASGVDLSDPSAWEVLGDDLEFGAQEPR
jgi:ferric-dicitrate binding protein FerR (iron transport regulator)